MLVLLVELMLTAAQQNLACRSKRPCLSTAMSAHGHMVHTRRKLVMARSEVKIAKLTRLGTMQMTVDMKAHTSVTVVTIIALIARR